jgi:hypothetical protein
MTTGRGAFLAQNHDAFPRHGTRRDGLKLRKNERYYLDLERSGKTLDKFKQPWRLYAIVVCKSTPRQFLDEELF